MDEFDILNFYILGSLGGSYLLEVDGCWQAYPNSCNENKVAKNCHYNKPKHPVCKFCIQIDLQTINQIQIDSSVTYTMDYVTNEPRKRWVGYGT